MRGCRDMKGNFKMVAIELLIFVLCLSLFPAHAFAKSSTVLGSTYEVPQEEIDKDTSIANLITSYSSIAGYTAYNWYGSQTTADNIYSAAFGVGDVYSISFYIGHGGSEYVWNWAGWIWYYEQQWFITDDNGGHVYDKDIFQHSECQNVKFVLLWSCHQGETIGGTHWSGTPFGMPYAWLHTTSLSSDGYASPDGTGHAFIGFDGVAPFLTYDGLGATDAGYYFLMYFYESSLYYGKYYSINEALDRAARLVWNVQNFADSVLYQGFTVSGYSGKMKVYGDGSIHISDYYPSGGGCPLLYVFDGSNYIYEGLMDIHDASGADVIQAYELTTFPELVDNAYLLRLVEHPVTHSHIDQVELYAVLDNGETIKLPLISAFHSEYGNVLRYLRSSDDVKIDVAANHVISLKFANVVPRKSQIVAFTFQIEGNNRIVKV